jgi:hypothetical protein
MAVYPKILKPWRGYPSSNTVMAIRAHAKQVGAEPGLGQVALTKDKGFHVGTIPAGSIVLPSHVHVLTGFTATVTVKLGTKAAPEGILASATIAPAATGFKAGLVGALTGFTAIQLEIFLLAEVAVPAAGEVDIVVPFYIQRD